MILNISLYYVHFDQPKNISETADNLQVTVIEHIYKRVVSSKETSDFGIRIKHPVLKYLSIKMLKGLFFLVLVTFICCQAKKCCFPQNWQLRQSMISAYADHKSKELNTYLADIYFDSVEKKIRKDIMTSKVNTTTLELFNAHVGFNIVNNKKCTLFEPGKFPSAPICIPGNWTRVDQYRLGYKPSINVEGFGHKDKVSTYVSVTDNCVPIGITLFGFPNADSMSINAAFFENYLPDVPDTSVFHVPPICKHAIRDLEFKNKPLHEEILWREMFGEYRHYV